MGKRVLLVEGNDDEHVFKALFGRAGLSHIEEIRQYGGYQSLIEALPVRLLESEVNSLGIVVDADIDPVARWASVSDRLKRAGYLGISETPPEAGLVVEPPTGALLPRVGVWMMPDNRLPGILESFLSYLVPEGDPLFAHACESIEQIHPSDRLFRSVDIPKARMHTWLAWQEEPGKPLGQSITRNVLRSESRAAAQVIEWLRVLFFDDHRDPPA